MTGYPNPGILVETDELAAHLRDPGLRIVDCHVVMTPRPDGRYDIASGRAAWAAAHIPGADFIDLADELSAPHLSLRFMMPPPEQFARVVGRHGIGNDNRVILYSAGLNYWATRLFLMFRAMGHDRVQVLNGGWDKWRREQRPISAEAPDRKPVTFVPHPRPGQILGKDDVRAVLGDERVRLVNALAPEVFRGEKGGYARLGHIPGSVNVPAADLVDPVTKCFRPADELRARFAASGALQAERIITYCGGGISATTDSFALLLLGREDVALYDGSMSEWAADTSLPLETGA